MQIMKYLFLSMHTVEMYLSECILVPILRALILDSCIQFMCNEL